MGIRVRADVYDWIVETAAAADGGKGRPPSTQVSVLLERLYERQMQAGVVRT